MLQIMGLNGLKRSILFVKDIWGWLVATTSTTKVIYQIFFLLDNLNEAIREFDSIKEKRDVVLCSLMALIIANKRTRTADKQSIQQLEAKLKSERTKCGETALFFGGMFLFHSGKADKAREYVDRMLKMSAESKEVKYPNVSSILQC